MKNYILNFGFILLLLIAFNSCKSTKQQPIPVLSIDTAKIFVSQLDTVTETSATTMTFKRQNNQWYSSRITIGTSTSDDEISGYIVNKRDSIIYLNINKFGIELARIVLTIDSISMVNRFEKTFYKGDYSIVNKLYGISLSFDMVQSIFLGEGFKDFFSTSQNNLQTDSTTVIDIPRSVDSIHKIVLHQMLTIDIKESVIRKNWMKDVQTQKVAIVDYLSYEKIEDYQFPCNYSIELPGMSVRIVTKSTKVNTPGPTSLSIPQKYTPMFP